MRHVVKWWVWLCVVFVFGLLEVTVPIFRSWGFGSRPIVDVFGVMFWRHGSVLLFCSGLVMACGAEAWVEGAARPVFGLIHIVFPLLLVGVAIVTYVEILDDVTFGSSYEPFLWSVLCLTAAYAMFWKLELAYRRGRM